MAIKGIGAYTLLPSWCKLLDWRERYLCCFRRGAKGTKTRQKDVGWQGSIGEVGRCDGDFGTVYSSLMACLDVLELGRW